MEQVFFDNSSDHQKTSVAADSGYCDSESRKYEPESSNQDAAVHANFIENNVLTVGDEVRLLTVRILKYEKLTGQVSVTSVVDLCVDSSQTILYTKRTSSDLICKVNHVIFIDNILDVFIRNDKNSFSSSSDLPNNLVLAIVYGQNFSNAKELLLLTNTAENAKLLCHKLRELLVQQNKQANRNLFYYWKRHMAKIKCSICSCPLTVDHITNSIFPQQEQSEKRNNLKNELLSQLPILDEKNECDSSVLDNTIFLLKLYRIITDGRKEVDKVYSLRFATSPTSTIGLPEFRTYINFERRHRKPNEVEPIASQKNIEDIFTVCNTIPQQANKWNTDAFLMFLLSQHNATARPSALQLNEESMKKPLSHYFIHSSHNTYLEDRQLGGTKPGRCSVSMYRRALYNGCRCLELDCWDGPDGEPMITHGPTSLFHCTTILFRDVIEAISETAFLASDYPVILSLENHCALKQQIKIANYCKEVFAEMLLTQPLEQYPITANTDLPPPCALRRKILIKNKKISSVDSTAEISESPKNLENMSLRACSEQPGAIKDKLDKMEPTSSSNDLANCRKSAENDIHFKDILIATELSELVNYMRAMPKFTSLSKCHTDRQSHSEMYSLNENKALELVKKHAKEFVHHNNQQITRIYPKRWRINSSNYMPITFWSCGFQMAALNLQTPDLPNQLNSTLFKNNGNSGYVLKPESMTRLTNKFDPFEVDLLENAMPLTLNIRIISGQLFCLLSDKTPLAIYVEVDLYGLPKDTCKCIYRTSTQTTDGLNTVFLEQKPVFSTYGGWQITDFPCRFTIEKIFFPELAFLRLAVYEESKSDPVGQAILQVKHLQPGHKHLVLTNEFNKPIGPVSLFVYFDVKDFKETSKSKNRPKIEVLSKEGVKYWHYKLKQSMAALDNK